MTFSYRDGVSVGEIIVYVPVLLIAIVLSIRHGFLRSSGWLFLITFSLARIIGPIFQLALISHPSSTFLITGAGILQSVGLSPLMLTALGLLGRIIHSISGHHRTFPNGRMLLLIHAVIGGGLILGVVGGIDASSDIKHGSYHPQGKSKIGVALFIVGYILIVLTTILTSFNASHADPGEKRLLVAVALSLPFFLVRLIYSILATFDTSSKTFNLIFGNVTVWLVMSVIMEFIIVIIFEVVGLTLRRVSKDPTAAPGSPSEAPDQGFLQQGQPGYHPGQNQGQQVYNGNYGAPTKGGNLNDIEMQRQPYGQ